MGTRGKGINQYLMDGIASGCIKCTLKTRPVWCTKYLVQNLINAKRGMTSNRVSDCVDARAKRVLVPAVDLQTVPAELLIKVQPIFYSDPIDVVFKALGAV